MEDKHGHYTHAQDEHSHDEHAEHHHGLLPNQTPHENGWVVSLPLILLAIPSLAIGYFTIEPFLYGDFFKGVIFINHDAHPVMRELTHEFHEVSHNAFGMAVHALTSLPFILALSGVVVAWFFYMKRPDIPAAIQHKFSLVNKVLEDAYGIDRLYVKVFANGSRLIGSGLWKFAEIGRAHV